MTAKQLIAKLEALVKEHGDLEVELAATHLGTISQVDYVHIEDGYEWFDIQ